MKFSHTLSWITSLSFLVSRVWYQGHLMSWCHLNHTQWQTWMQVGQFSRTSNAQNGLVQYFRDSYIKAHSIWHVLRKLVDIWWLRGLQSCSTKIFPNDTYRLEKSGMLTCSDSRYRVLLAGICFYDYNARKLDRTSWLIAWSCGKNRAFWLDYYDG